MIEPSDYYDACDATAGTLSEVKTYIDLVEQFAATNDLKVFWRGQADHRWGLVSSLVRRLAATTSVNDSLLNKVEETLLSEAVGWIADLKQPQFAYPLAQLAYLQHHGIPTRLIDFTTNPWMAVFFAAESVEHEDGRMFALLVDPANVITATPPGTPWRGEYKTNEVRIFDPKAAGIAFPRVTAQEGVLAVGRLPSTRPHREARDKLLGITRSLLAEEVRRVLSIPFKLSPFVPNNVAGAIPVGAQPPIGLTFRLHVDKESIRRDLSGHGQGKRICPAGMRATHHSVYPDASGMVAHSKTLRGLERGVLLV